MVESDPSRKASRLCKQIMWLRWTVPVPGCWHCSIRSTRASQQHITLLPWNIRDVPDLAPEEAMRTTCGMQMWRCSLGHTSLHNEEPKHGIAQLSTTTANAAARLRQITTNSKNNLHCRRKQSSDNASANLANPAVNAHMRMHIHTQINERASLDSKGATCHCVDACLKLAL